MFALILLVLPLVLVFGFCAGGVVAILHRRNRLGLVLIGCALLVVVVGTVGMLSMLFGLRAGPRSAPTVAVTLPPDVRARHLTGGRLLGELAAREFAGQPVRLVVHPASVRGLAEGVMMEGVLTAMAAAPTPPVVAVVELEQASGTPEAPWIGAAAFETAFAQEPRPAAIITLAGLPDRLEALNYWRQPSPPPLIVANAPVYLLRKMMVAGLIRAVLIPRPWQPGSGQPGSPDPEPPPAGSPEEWLLVTPESVNAIHERYPGIFVSQ